MLDRSSVAVVGGGILGMALAARLAEQGYRVQLLEKQSVTGGLAASGPIGQVEWDRFYHVILRSDRQLLGWLERLELSPGLTWNRTRTGFYVDGELHSLSSSWEFLRFPALGLWDKARLALTIMKAARTNDPMPLEEQTALEWLTRWSGPRVVEKLWRPLLYSKLGTLAPQASAAFIWAIIARMYAARRSGMKREEFGYVAGGYRTILQAFNQLLDQLEVEVAAGTPVTRVTSERSGVSLSLSDGSVRRVDHVVLTVPCRIAALLCPQLQADEQARLRGVSYQGVVCPSFLLRRELAGFYVTNLTDPELPFTGIIEMTALVDRDTFGGHTLVYLPKYLAADDVLWDQDDAAISQSFFDGLRKVHPSLRENDIVARRVARAREVLAVSTLNYSRRLLPPVATSVNGVSLVNSAQIAHGTLNVNETLSLVEQKLPELTARISASTAERAPSR